MAGFLIAAIYLFPSLLPWGATGDDEEPGEKVENVQKKAAAPVQEQSESSEEAEESASSQAFDLQAARDAIRKAAEEDKTCSVADYDCGAWGSCVRGWQLRVCKLYKECENTIDIKPQEKRTCTADSRVGRP